MTLNVFFGEASTDGILALLTVTSAGQPPLRVVANNESIVSRGETFEPYPFNLTLPVDAASDRPRASIEIDNVSGEIMETIRQFLEPPTLKIELVLMSDPDTVEKTIDFLRLTNVEYDALAIRGDLEPVDIWSQPAVAQTYNPGEFPGLRGAA